MTKVHVQKRMDWASPRLTWTDEMWSKVVFSDEKKFNLDGPDGFKYYWHALGHDYKHYSTRAHGGGSVMIWASFSKNGKSHIAFLSRRQNSTKYCETLQAYLLPFCERIGVEDWTFQQDNASIHKSAQTTEWLRNTVANVLEWPAKSPDMNPIENLWGILARMVYSEQDAYDSVEALKTAIKLAWNRIPQSTLAKLSDSMKTRVATMYRAHGKAIKY